MPTVGLDSGSIHYTEAGPADGPVVVCVHGYLMAGSLFDQLAARLATGASARSPRRGRSAPIPSRWRPAPT